MDTIKTRKQGNTVGITFPKKLHVRVGQEYYIHKSSNGVITLIPKAKDIYANAKPGEYWDADTDDLAKNFVPRGKEL